MKITRYDQKLIIISNISITFYAVYIYLISHQIDESTLLAKAAATCVIYMYFILQKDRTM